MRGLSWGFTSRAGHWLCAEISTPIDRGSRLMGACRFDGYDCTERGGVVIYIYKKKPRLLDDGPEKIFSETQRVRERVAAVVGPLQGGNGCLDL